MKTINGDILKLAKNGEFDVIIQGCNCQNTMGKGIAKQIKDQFPEAYKADCETIKGDKSKLGTFSFTKAKHYDFIICNAYTQYNFRPSYDNDGKTYVDYDAIRSSFKAIRQTFGDSVRYAYPLIGCGLAGGNWDIVSQIINEVFEGLDHTLVIYG